MKTATSTAIMKYVLVIFLVGAYMITRKIMNAWIAADDFTLFDETRTLLKGPLCFGSSGGGTCTCHIAPRAYHCEDYERTFTITTTSDTFSYTYTFTAPFDIVPCGSLEQDGFCTRDSRNNPVCAEIPFLETEKPNECRRDKDCEEG